MTPDRPSAKDLPKKRVAVLISGTGSNLQALVRAAEVPSYPAEICLVLSDNRDAAGLCRANEAGIANFAVDYLRHDTKAAFERALTELLCAHDIDLVCLAGFMRILSPGFVSRWPGRILNIHPSLLPAYKGLNTHRRALEAGERLSGCTVHIVTPDLDAGPILGQTEVEIMPNDTAGTLAARILAQEHLLYPSALAAFCRRC